MGSFLFILSGYCHFKVFKSSLLLRHLSLGANNFALYPKFMYSTDNFLSPFRPLAPMCTLPQTHARTQFQFLLSYPSPPLSVRCFFLSRYSQLNLLFNMARSEIRCNRRCARTPAKDRANSNWIIENFFHSEVCSMHGLSIC